MTIESFFQQYEAMGYQFPARGQVIEVRRRGTIDWQLGRCEYCWAGIEPVITLADGGGFLHVTLGDEWRPAVGRVP